MKTAINHTWFYNHPPQDVWEYLTKSELIAEWLMNNDFKPIVGHEFQFRVRAMPAFDFDGIIYCKVLEIIPYKKLIYSWKGGPEKGKINLDTIVEWTLTPKDNGTELQVTQSGFKNENLSIMSLMDEGWLKNIKKIVDLLKTESNDASRP